MSARNNTTLPEICRRVEKGNKEKHEGLEVLASGGDNILKLKTTRKKMRWGKEERLNARILCEEVTKRWATGLLLTYRHKEKTFSKGSWIKEGKFTLIVS